MPNKVEWDKVKVRCSNLGRLLTEPKSKADKEAGKLSATAQIMLREMYVQLKYDRKKDVETKYMTKGNLVEEESITRISLFDNVLYQKNEELISNDFIQGTPDIYLGKSVYEADVISDAKSSYDLVTFVSNVGEELDKGYRWQVLGYMWISGAKKGSVDYVLNDLPQIMLFDEMRRLMYKMNAATEESPEYKAAVEVLKKQYTYKDIPEEERILRFPVVRDEDAIGRIEEYVIKARTWLAEFEDKHLNHNRTLVYIP